MDLMDYHHHLLLLLARLLQHRNHCSSRRQQRTYRHRAHNSITRLIWPRPVTAQRAIIYQRTIFWMDLTRTIQFTLNWRLLCTTAKFRKSILSRRTFRTTSSKGNFCNSLVQLIHQRSLLWTIKTVTTARPERLRRNMSCVNAKTSASRHGNENVNPPSTAWQVYRIPPILWRHLLQEAHSLVSQLNRPAGQLIYQTTSLRPPVLPLSSDAWAVIWNTLINLSRERGLHLRQTLAGNLRPRCRLVLYLTPLSHVSSPSQAVSTSYVFKCRVQRNPSVSVAKIRT